MTYIILKDATGNNIMHCIYGISKQFSNAEYLLNLNQFGVTFNFKPLMNLNNKFGETPKQYLWSCNLLELYNCMSRSNKFK